MPAHEQDPSSPRYGALVAGVDVAASAPDTVAASYARAIGAQGAGDLPGVLAAVEAGLEFLCRDDDPDPFDAANLQLVRAQALRSSDSMAAFAAARQALEHAEAAGDGAEESRLRVQVLAEVAAAGLDTGDYATARRSAEDAKNIASEQLGEGDLHTAAAWNVLGMCHRYQGALEDAADCYQRAMQVAEQVGEDPEVAAIAHNLSSLAHLSGDLPLAEHWIRRALGCRAPDDPARTDDLAVLAAVLGDTDRHLEAADAYEQARSELERRTDGGRDLVFLVANEAVFAHRSGSRERAEELYADATARAERLLGAGHPQTGTVLANWASLAAAQGQRARSKAMARRAVTILSAVVSDDLPSLQLARELLR